MFKYLWLFAPLFIFFTLLPNYCFAFANHGLKIEEIKTKGITNFSNSHSGEWLEITNTSNDQIDLYNYCIVSKKEADSTLKPNNCFPEKSFLDPHQIAIVAYSGINFLADNSLIVENIKNKGYLFELGDFVSGENIASMTDISKSRLYLNDTAGEIYLFNKINPRDVIDYFAWNENLDKNQSFQRPVYDADFDFVATTPTPFQILPEFVAIASKNISFNSASFDLARINDPTKQIDENISLWQNNQQIGATENVNAQNQIEFNNLASGTNYQLQFSACEKNTNFCFTTSGIFTTKQNYLLLKINELYPAPRTSVGEKEWFEIFNPNSQDIILDDWYVQDRSGHEFNLSGTISAGKYAIFYPGSKLSLNNNGDDLKLFDPNGDLRDKVSYKKAIKQFSYSRFKNEFSWSRKKTPGKQNILVAEYLPQKIGQIKNQEEKAQVAGQVIVAPGDFAKYFYLNDDSFALKIKPNNKLNLIHGKCIMIFGKIKANKEKYLKLEEYHLLNSCDLITPAIFVDPNNDYINNLIGRLIRLKGEIYTEKSSYFINYQDQKIKLRATFKLNKGFGEIMGVLGFGTTYYQLFIVNKQWFNVAPKINSPPDHKYSVDKKTNVVLAKTINTKGASYQSLEDFRSDEYRENRQNYYYLIFYYLSLIIFSALAKLLVFG